MLDQVRDQLLAERARARMNGMGNSRKISSIRLVAVPVAACGSTQMERRLRIVTEDEDGPRTRPRRRLAVQR